MKDRTQPDHRLTPSHASLGPAAGARDTAGRRQPDADPPTPENVQYVTVMDDGFAEPPQRRPSPTGATAAQRVEDPVRLAARWTDRPQRILIVDDEHEAADDLALLLTHSGHTVRQAYDGAAAIALAVEFQPEIILLDLVMPGTDGFDVALQLRELPGTREAKILALTGHSEQAYREATREAHFDGHLLKPLDLGDLDKVIAWQRSPFPH